MKTLKKYFMLVMFLTLTLPMFASSLDFFIRPPKDDGGSPIREYIIEYMNTKVGPPWRILARTPYSIYSATNLIEGNEYFFRVKAVNDYGIGAPGPQVFFRMPNDKWSYSIDINSGNGYPMAKTKSSTFKIPNFSKSKTLDVKIPLRPKE